MTHILQRDVQALFQAERAIVAAQLRAAIGKSIAFLVAGFIALIGLVMANGAAYCALYPSFGPTLTLTIIAAVDFLLAAAIGLGAAFIARRPPELALLQRQSALDSLRSQYDSCKERAAGILRKPLDLAARRTASVLLRAFVRNRKNKSTVVD